jgi:hypothetical protein
VANYENIVGAVLVVLALAGGGCLSYKLMNMFKKKGYYNSIRGQKSAGFYCILPIYGFFFLAMFIWYLLFFSCEVLK